MDLSPLLKPQSIAIVGIADNSATLGGRVFKGLVSHGYKGRIFPISAEHEQVEGIRCYPRLADINSEIDAILIALEGKQVTKIVEESGKKGIKSAIIYAGSSIGLGEGGRLEGNRIMGLAKNYDLLICGLNSGGIVNFRENITMSSSQFLDLPQFISGNIAFVSQGGSLGEAIINRAQDKGIGSSYFISTGNEAVLELSDYIEYLLNDPHTSVICVLMEGIRDAEKLLRVADLALERKKPIIVMKVGRTAAGRKAVSSHTGLMAGTDAVYEAIFRQKGFIRVFDPDELYETAAVLTKRNIPKGNRIGIISTTGGGGVVLLDKLTELDMTIPEVDPKTDRELFKIIANFDSVNNPLHLKSQYASDPLVFTRALEVFARDEALDAVIVVIPMSPDEQGEEMARHIARVAKSLEKPMLIWWPGGHITASEIKIFRESSIPFFRSLSQCAMALAASIRYGEFLKNHHGEKAAALSISPSGRERIEAILESSGRVLTEDLGKEILSIYDIPIASEKVSRSLDEGQKFAIEIGYPVALKIISPQIAHKTEIGALRLSIGNADELSLAYKQILDNAKKRSPEAEIRGVLVQEMAKPGKEVIVGMVLDPQFGPMIMFGLGGIFVEVLKDFSLRCAPLKEKDSWAMIQEIKGYPALKGIRGSPSYDVAAIVRVLMAISQLAMDLKDIISSIDINPLIVYPEGQGVKALDCLIVKK